VALKKKDAATGKETNAPAALSENANVKTLSKFAGGQEERVKTKIAKFPLLKKDQRTVKGWPSDFLERKRAWKLPTS